MRTILINEWLAVKLLRTILINDIPMGYPDSSRRCQRHTCCGAQLPITGKSAMMMAGKIKPVSPMPKPTPQDLARAARSGRLEAVQALLESGLGREQPAELGLGLAMACFLGHRDIVRELVKRGAPLNLPPALAEASPLVMAIKGGQKKTTRLLISLGAKVPAGLDTGLTPEEYEEALAKARERAARRAARHKAAAHAKPKPAPRPASSPAAVPIVPVPAPPLPRAEVRIAAAPSPSRKTQPKSAPALEVVPAALRRSRGGIMEEIELTACFGVDTNVLEADLMRWNATEAPVEPPSLDAPAIDFEKNR